MAAKTRWTVFLAAIAVAAPSACAPGRPAATLVPRTEALEKVAAEHPEREFTALYDQLERSRSEYEAGIELIVSGEEVPGEAPRPLKSYRCYLNTLPALDEHGEGAAMLDLDLFGVCLRCPQAVGDIARHVVSTDSDHSAGDNSPVDDGHHVGRSSADIENHHPELPFI